MHDFRFRDNSLYCENVPVSLVAEAVETPFYLYSRKTILDHYRKLDQALEPVEHLICYSVKANFNLAILKTLAEQGAGADIVSGGELFRALRAGIPPQKIVYSGVGKRWDELQYTLETDILMINVESVPELHLLNRMAGEMGKRARIAFRINPDVEARTHHYITTGERENKFGLPIDLAVDLYLQAAEMENIQICGIDTHIGSQIVSVEPYVEAMGKLRRVVEEIQAKGIEIEFFNMGGGMGIIYDQEAPSTAQEFAERVLPVVEGLGCKVIIEPGRFIVGNAGILVTRVLYLKKTPTKNFVIVDAGMNDLIRPSLYGAYHKVEPVERRSNGTTVADVVGPVCESGDFFALEREIERVEPGDLLAIMSAGAYGFSMASNYNSRPRPAEVMVDDHRFWVIRERESYEDLIRGEQL